MPLNPAMQKVVFGGPDKLANYDYADIANGTGIVNFYAGNAASGATTHKYFLSNIAFYSDDIVISEVGHLGISFAKNLDIDYDVILNLPRIMKGKAILNVPTALSTSAAGKTVHSFVRALIRKWDGTTETDIASASGAILDVTGSADGDRMNCLVMDVPQTNLKKGETLRLTIEVWDRDDDGTTAYTTRLGQDPMNRANTYFGTNPTQATIKLPFLIDI